ncbi:PREDICTED: F-box/LRR-repeat protein At3g48880-like isoform X2 [Tarenaya hassleriana]|uniref:F-box/LRR-repeat protein At3g48880-like isoform X2 n=1 Tax=Tarenaya hassleriana TaxID=28532 RepID=UPI00053C2556|nr:PREDICTED: F-box/LRR-repeat protein At3g48880-like isoform X2 [Tarenaya hassleriana]
MEGSDSSQSPWANMEYDVLVKIFMTLNLMDLVYGVAGVCQSWRAAAHDPLLWEKIDFTSSSSHPIIARRVSYWADMHSRLRFKQMLKTIAKFSGDAVTRLYFSFYIYVDDKHITYATKRFPNIKWLALPGWNNINETTFIRSLAGWRNLESITFPSICSPTSVMKFLGEHCQNFTKLKMIHTFDYSCAEAVVNLLPNLKVLSLRSSIVYKDALYHLVEHAPSLLALNVAHCLVFELDELPTYREIFEPVTYKGHSRTHTTGSRALLQLDTVAPLCSKILLRFL